MTENYPTEHMDTAPEQDVIVAEVKTILEGYSREAIRVAAHLQSHLVMTHAVEGELTLDQTIEERIRSALR